MNTYTQNNTTPYDFIPVEEDIIGLSTSEFMHVFNEKALDPYDAYNEIENIYEENKEEINIAKENGAEKTDVEIISNINDSLHLQASSIISDYEKSSQIESDLILDTDIEKPTKEKLHIIRACMKALNVALERSNALFATLGIGVYSATFRILSSPQYLCVRGLLYCKKKEIQSARNIYENQLLKMKAKALRKYKRNELWKKVFKTELYQKIEFSKKDLRHLENAKNNVLNQEDPYITLTHMVNIHSDAYQYNNKSIKNRIANIFGKGEKQKFSPIKNYKTFIEQEKDRDAKNSLLENFNYEKIANSGDLMNNLNFLLDKTPTYMLKDESDKEMSSGNEKDSNSLYIDARLGDEGVPVIPPDMNNNSMHHEFSDSINMDAVISERLNTPFLKQMGVVGVVKEELSSFLKEYDLYYIDEKIAFATALGLHSTSISKDKIAELINLNYSAAQMEAVFRSQVEYPNIDVTVFLTKEMTYEQICYSAEAFSVLPPRIVDIDKINALSIEQIKSLTQLSNSKLYSEDEIGMALERFSQDETSTLSDVITAIQHSRDRESIINLLSENEKNEKLKLLSDCCAVLDTFGVDNLNSHVLKTDMFQNGISIIEEYGFTEKEARAFIYSSDILTMFIKYPDLTVDSFKDLVLEEIKDEPTIIRYLPNEYHDDFDFLNQCYENNAETLDSMDNEDFIEAKLDELSYDVDPYDAVIEPRPDGFSTLDEALESAKKETERRYIYTALDAVKDIPFNSHVSFSFEQESVNVSRDSDGYFSAEYYNKDLERYEKISEERLLELIKQNPRSFLHSIKREKKDLEPFYDL